MNNKAIAKKLAEAYVIAAGLPEADPLFSSVVEKIAASALFRHFTQDVISTANNAQFQPGFQRYWREAQRECPNRLRETLEDQKDLI